MGMVITLFLALATTTVAYAVLGQGGGVAGVIFFGILVIGATIRVFTPSSDRLSARRGHLQVLGFEHQAPCRRPRCTPRGRPSCPPSARPRPPARLVRRPPWSARSRFGRNRGSGRRSGRPGVICAARPAALRSRRRIPRAGGPRCPREAAGRRPGGGGACLAIVMNILPTPPSGTQLAIPIRPPGLQTRSSSAAVFSLFGREHRAEDRDHDVELALAEGEVGGVALDELDLESLGRRALAPALEQGGDEVDADRVAPRSSRRGKRAVAAAAGDVEHPLVGHDVHRFDQLLGHHLDHPGDHREVTLRPGLLLRLPDRTQIHRVAHLRSLRSSPSNCINFSPAG